MRRIDRFGGGWHVNGTFNLSVIARLSRERWTCSSQFSRGCSKMTSPSSRTMTSVCERNAGSFSTTKDDKAWAVVTTMSCGLPFSREPQLRPVCRTKAESLLPSISVEAT